MKDEGVQMAPQKGWSQSYTCTSCRYQMTLWFDGTKLRIKGKGPQEQKPNMRRTSATNDVSLECPNCGHPLPPNYTG